MKKAALSIILSVTALLLLCGVFSSYGEGIEKKPKIALTFDDGPQRGRTDKILDVLKKYGIRATFFIVGENVSGNEELLARERDEGHEIGNHTFTHPKLRKTASTELKSELERTEKAIVDAVGVRPKLFRPPEGFCSSEVQSAADKKGYDLVLWTVDTLDWKGVSADRIVATILKQTAEGSIILCHDYIWGNSNTAKAMDKAIPLLLEKGFEFVTVSELLTA